MRSINSRSTSLDQAEPDDMILVLRPERGHFSVDTVKRWATETLFIEEGTLMEANSLSIEEAVDILHQYDFARISR